MLNIFYIPNCTFKFIYTRNNLNIMYILNFMLNYINLIIVYVPKCTDNSINTLKQWHLFNRGILSNFPNQTLTIHVEKYGVYQPPKTKQFNERRIKIRCNF